MQKIREILDAVEAFAPLNKQADYDNCGLIWGDTNREATGIMLTLELTESVAEEAKNKNCNLIIEHHPSIFYAVKKLDCRLPSIKALSLAIRYDIAVYAAHTSVDFVDGGLNDYFIERLGCIDVQKINDDPMNPRIGRLKSPATLKECAVRFKDILQDENIWFTGDPQKRIETVAAANGGGGSDAELVLSAKEAGADLFISSDFKYHVIMLAKELNYAIMSCGHYNSEILFTPLLQKVLDGKCRCPVYQAESVTNPITRQE